MARRRPVFLNRNIRQFKARHSNSKATKATAISGHLRPDNDSETTATTDTSNMTTTTTSSLSTSSETNIRISAESTTSFTPSDSTALTLQHADHHSTITSTTSNTAVSVATSSVISTANDPTANTSTSVTSSETAVSTTSTTTCAVDQSNAFWSGRRSPPDRMGSTAGVRDGYIVDDCAEMKLNMTSYRMVFVMNKDVIFYKRQSLLRSRQVSQFFLFV